MYLITKNKQDIRKVKLFNIVNKLNNKSPILKVSEHIHSYIDKKGHQDKHI